MALFPVLQTLASILPYVLGPPATVYAVLRLLALYVPPLLSLLLCITSVPAYFVASVAWTKHATRREAAKLGAIVPPFIPDDDWLGRNVMKTIINNFEKGYMGDHFITWAETYGWTFTISAMGEDRVFTTEPEYIKAILATNFQGFGKGPQIHAQHKDILGNGVFNTDGDMWKFHRGMTRPFFSRERISDFDIFERHTQKALKPLRRRLQEGYAVDFQDLASRFTIDAATEFLFGSDLQSLSAPLPYPSSDRRAVDVSHPNDRFSIAFVEAQTQIGRRARYGTAWPLFEIFNPRHEENLMVIKSFIEPIVNRAIERAAEEDPIDDKGEPIEVLEGETLLDYMVKSTRDPTLLCDETINILLAGRDTTAALLSTTIYALSQNPSVMERLRSEVLHIVGSERAPTPVDIREMKYMRAVLNEVMRLWPPVPFNARRSTKATTWPSQEPGGKPFYIAPNTRCTYSVFLMHRRTDLWGPDALNFDPDRFLDERVKYITANPFIFLPFNAGPRICLGQQFAYNEASFFLVRLLQSFSQVSLALDAQPPESLPAWPGREKLWMKSHLTMYCAGGVWVRMKAA